MPKPDPPADWPGFNAPHYTPIPDDLFDVWLPHLSGAELKVLLYICRHTFGWKKDSDDISLAQLTGGITRTDGSVLDAGTGLGETTVLGAVKGLVRYGLITATRQRNRHGGDAPTRYRPRLRGSPVSGEGGPRKVGRGSPERAAAPPLEVGTQETGTRNTKQEEEPVSEFSPAEHEVMRRAGITPDEYRALRGLKQ